MVQSQALFASAVRRLGELCEDVGRSLDDIERTAMVRDPSAREIDSWRFAGATRLIVAPWRRSAEAIDGLAAFRPHH